MPTTPKAPSLSLRLSLTLCFFHLLCFGVASGAPIEKCDVGRRVLAYREEQHCLPTDTTCWQPGTIGDGLGRNDAFRTILWDDGNPFGQRVHGSYVRVNATGQHCARPGAVSDLSRCEPGNMCWRYVDACLDRHGEVGLPPAKLIKNCSEVVRTRQCSRYSRWCPLSCGLCEARSTCLDIKKMVSRLFRYAFWGWQSQWHQDSIFHHVFIHPKGLYIPPEQRFFVEFGFQMLPFGTNVDSNTEYLKRQGWKGMAFDINNENPNYPVYKAPITPNTVIDLFLSHGVPKVLGLISIDIDSCDFWVFLRLATVFRPAVYQVEYNRHLRVNDNYTAACDGDGNPVGNKFSGQVYGASMQAIVTAGRSRGYTPFWVQRCFDVFFVRDDLVCEGSALKNLLPFKGMSFFEDGCHDPWGRSKEDITEAQLRSRMLDLSKANVPEFGETVERAEVEG